MGTLAMPQPPALRWNWPRVGALSGTLSLHLIAIALLLVPPLAMKLAQPARQEITVVDLIKDPPHVEEPPLPVPRRIVHEVRQKPVLPPAVAPPLAPVDSTLQIPVAAPPKTSGDVAPQTSGDTAPAALAYLTRTRIPYPKDALKRHEQGTVILRVLVGADGLPQTVEIEKSSGSRSLDLAARAAVAHWTFMPGTLNGVRSALWARVPIAFDLQLL